jgi:hypothetical protein
VVIRTASSFGNGEGAASPVPTLTLTGDVAMIFGVSVGYIPRPASSAKG